jgi:hypothetical protein
MASDELMTCGNAAMGKDMVVCAVEDRSYI